MALWASVVILAVATQAAGHRVENLYRYNSSKTFKEIEKCGLVGEQHEVKTSDGFILTTFRLHGREKPAERSVIVQHGFLSSSDKWFHMGNHSLPCMLAWAGYDVWVSNSRGNRFSQKHLYLRDSSEGYWNFSFHEMAVFDLRANINYIIDVTKKTMVSYVGKGIGANMVLALLAEDDKFNKKIDKSIMMAPSCILSHTDDQILKFMSYLPQYMDEHWKNWTDGKLPHWYPGMPVYENETYIRDTMKILADILHMEQQDKSEYTIESTSLKTAGHLGQLVRNDGSFNRYDYGKAGNQLMYHQDKVPQYRTSKITTTQYIIYSEHDNVVNTKDVRALCDLLPQSSNAQCHKVSKPEFRHGDFMRGDMAKEIYAIVLRELDNARGNPPGRHSTHPQLGK